VWVLVQFARLSPHFFAALCAFFAFFAVRQTGTAKSAKCRKGKLDQYLKWALRKPRNISTAVDEFVGEGGVEGKKGADRVPW
jgi:hypothetical protein